ncbi:hypothetical protein B0H17DRAFT_1034856 [Mycena rosella]|uniref:Uncharacterized protein n=1 Tax=Mycena rosella TaxID=1033263 RepID=A0AAD7GWS4_MYCRO|nr:hypothetical protein B0H17DRAFT_1034856 [Mycena rosella]
MSTRSMAQLSPADSKNPSAPVPPNKPIGKPLKPTGIIILPPSSPRPYDDDSPPSSTSDSQMAASMPDLPGAALSRRASTSTSSLNVKFAPLPQLAPRKRRSTAPLGIASRALMMRRRRAGMPGYDMNGDPLPAWTDEEVERHTQRILAERSGQPLREREGDDPFLTLGKMVKGAGKQFWRKVNNKRPGEGEEKEKDAGGGVVVAERMVLGTISADNTGTPSQEEGGVWEEEVGDRFPLNVGQTETIVEGQFSWSAAHLKPSLEDTGSVSDDASARERTLSSAEGTEEGSTLGEPTRSHSFS